MKAGSRFRLLSASFAGDGLTGKASEKPPERVRGGGDWKESGSPCSSGKDRPFIFPPRCCSVEGVCEES